MTSDGNPPGDVRDTTVLGLKWSAGIEAVRFTVVFAVSIVLARLLRPEEFGQVGMVLVFTTCGSLFGDMGFSLALVQRERVEDRDLAAVFWFHLFAGAVLATCFVTFAPVIAAFYGTAEVTRLARVAAIQFLVYPLSSVQKAQLTRSMSFSRLLGAEIAGTGLGAAVGIGGALLGWGAVSLVYRALAAELTTAVLIWRLHPWRPRSGPSLVALADLWGFARGLAASRVNIYIQTQSDDLLIGRFLGATSLGIYDRAFAMVGMVLLLVRNVAGRVMVASLARIQDDRARVKSVYLRSVRLIGLLFAPIMAGLAGVADPLVRLLYGDGWADVAPVLRVYCAIGFLQAIGTTTGWILVSQGRTDLLFRWSVVTTAVVVPCFGLGVWAGAPVYLALWHLGGVLLLIYPAIRLPGSLIGLRVGEVARALALPCAAAVLMLATIWSTDRLLLAGEAPAVTVVVLVAEGVAVFAGLACLWMRESLRGALELVRGQRPKLSAPSSGWLT